MGLFTNSNDPVPETRSVSAFFVTRAAAEQARTEVVGIGVSSEAVKITDGRGTITGRGAAAQPAAGGLVDTLKNAFAQDTPGPAEEEGRRGFVVTAHVPASLFDRTLALLGREGEISQARG